MKRIETYKTIEDIIAYILIRINAILKYLAGLRDKNQNVFKKLNEVKIYFNEKLEHKKSRREQYEKDYVNRCKVSSTSKSTSVVTLTSATTSGVTTIATTTPAATGSPPNLPENLSKSSPKLITDETTP